MVGRHNGVRLPSGMKMQILRVMTEECENFQKLKIQYGKWQLFWKSFYICILVKYYQMWKFVCMLNSNN